MSTNDWASDARAGLARQWASDQLGLTADFFAPASSDASFRRYFRFGSGSRSWIVMDAPPDREDCRPFIRVAGLMREAGLNVPDIVAQDASRGFLLLGDLGSRTYLDELTESNAQDLFEDALVALVHWQQSSREHVLPDYDRSLLQRELNLFPDWFLKRHLQLELTAGEQAEWQAVNDTMLERILAQPRVFVHRDYMPRNLMLCPQNPGVLDFQDAVMGPISYDVTSLFKDAFVSWPDKIVEWGLRRYWQLASEAGLPMPAFKVFRQWSDWMGLQRHLKVLGIFARIRYRDGKPYYLTDAPRFVRYVMDVTGKYDELQTLHRLFEVKILPVVGHVD